MSNPLLQEFTTPYQVPPFQQIKTAHFVPAIQSLIEETLEEVNEIANNSESPTFQNTIEALEHAGEKLGIVSSVLFNLNSAETSDELQKVTQEASPILTEFDNTIKQNEKLFARIKSVYAQRDHFEGEQLMLLDKTYKSFIRSGADLNSTDKNRFKEIATELATLSLTFGEHVLAETNAFELILENKEDLSGLPNDVIDRAAHLARSKGHETKWMFTLQAPSYIPFMEYADNRELRETLFKAYMNKAFKGDDNDNQQLVKKIVELRHEKAQLLGFDSYASYVLQERMAEKPSNVTGFLEDLLQRALPFAQAEVDELKSFMNEEGITHELQRWDWAYYSEKLRKKKFDLDDEVDQALFQAGKCHRRGF